MKSAGLILVLTIATVAPGYAQLSPAPSPEAVKLATEPTTGAKLSPAVSEQLTSTLPKYTPVEQAKPVEGPKPLVADGPTDPDVLQLKKVTVTPKKRPRLTDDVMLTTKAYNDKLAREKTSALDRNVLNKFTLPSWFGGVSAAERARDERDREQRAQMANDVVGLARVVEVSDPEQAKQLRDAMARP